MSKCCCCRNGYGVVKPYALNPYGTSPTGVSPYTAGAPTRGGLLGGLGAGGYGGGCGWGGCNFACFIILILILLTFTNNRPVGPCGTNEIATDGYYNNYNDNFGGVGKGILFVIALYYLSCWVPCARGGYGGGFGGGGYY